MGPQCSTAILDRLVALNLERTAEEAAGTIRWLRPAFQNPGARGPSTSSGRTAELGLETMPASVAADGKMAWPAALPDQVASIARVLAETQTPLSLDQLATRFSGKGKWKSRLPDILATLAALGRARESDGGWSGT